MSTTNLNSEIENWVGISATASPWSDLRKDSLKFKLILIDITESIGGELAGGTLEFDYIGSEKDTALFIEKEFYEIDGGLISLKSTKKNLSIPYVIVNRKIQLNTITFDIICGINDIKILNTPRSSGKFDSVLYTAGIDSAISNLWPGEIIKDSTVLPTSEISNLKLTQIGKSNKDFLETLCSGYRLNTIFGFGLEGLRFNELCSDKSKVRTVRSGVECEIVEIPRYKYKRKLSINSGYSDSTSNSTMTYKMESVNIVHKDYKVLMTNIINNRDIMSNDTSIISITCPLGLTPFELGDVVKIDRELEELRRETYTYYIVKAIHIFYTVPGSNSNGVNYQDSLGRSFSASATLYGLESGKWAFKEEEN